MPETLLAFDVGTRRIGIAVGNTETRLAQALEIVDAAQAIARAAELVAVWSPARFVVGLPLREDGTETQGTAPARRFAGRLQGRFGKPVAFVDERYTSVEAARGRATIAPVDHLAAALILQQYLDALAPGA